MLSSWWRKREVSRPVGRPQGRRSPTRPSLEVLEDRAMPAVSPANPMAANGAAVASLASTTPTNNLLLARRGRTDWLANENSDSRRWDSDRRPHRSRLGSEPARGAGNRFTWLVHLDQFRAARRLAVTGRSHWVHRADRLRQHGNSTARGQRHGRFQPGRRRGANRAVSQRRRRRQRPGGPARPPADGPTTAATARGVF